MTDWRCGRCPSRLTPLLAGADAQSLCPTELGRVGEGNDQFYRISATEQKAAKDLERRRKRQQAFCEVHWTAQPP